MQRIDFKSDEEFFFYNWLLEGQENGLITDIDYQPEPYLLTPRATTTYNKIVRGKEKHVEKFLFNPHKYTTDFKFSVASSLKEYFIHSMYFDRCTIIVDIKGVFNKYGDPKQFSMNQKWVYDKYGVYVEKIVPDKFFKKTWCPEICRYTPVKKNPVKKFIEIPTVQEFIENIK